MATWSRQWFTYSFAIISFLVYAITNISWYVLSLSGLFENILIVMLLISFVAAAKSLLSKNIISSALYLGVPGLIFAFHLMGFTEMLQTEGFHTFSDPFPERLADCSSEEYVESGKSETLASCGNFKRVLDNDIVSIIVDTGGQISKKPEKRSEEWKKASKKLLFKYAQNDIFDHRVIKLSSSTYSVDLSN